MKFTKILLIASLLIGLSLPTWAQKKTVKPTKAQRYDTLITLTTQFGAINMLLYEDTPKHRSNFLKLVKQKFYDGLLFHRVISGFMIQGGDPTSKNAKAEQMIGSGGLSYRIDAEFRANHIHKKGALAAARDGNPERASSSCQFYLVQGATYTEEALRGKTQVKYTNDQAEAYKKIGGTPHLDQNYTVFGEIIKGIEIMDTIAKQPTGRNDRPQKDVQMSITFKKMKKTEITKKFGYIYPEIK